MIEQAKQIIEGHANHLLSKVGLLPGDTEMLAAQRMETCQRCERLANNSTCQVCGCYMPAKTKVIEATCPEKKW